MIWPPPMSGTTTARATLVEEIHTLCAPAWELDPAERRHLAAAVACHLVAGPPRLAERAELSGLAARALRSIGRPQAATRVLALGAGILQPASSAAAPGLPVWALDLPRLVAPGRDRLELLLFRALDALLEAAAGLWDARAGAGILALRRAGPAARLLLGPGAPVRRVIALRREIREACQRRLRAGAPARRWRQEPDVLFLDAPPA